MNTQLYHAIYFELLGICHEKLQCLPKWQHKSWQLNRSTIRTTQGLRLVLSVATGEQLYPWKNSLERKVWDSRLMMSSGKAGSSMVGPQRTTRMLEMFMVCSKNPMHLRLVRLWQWSIVIVHRSFVPTAKQRRIGSHLEASRGQLVNDSSERKRACTSRSPQLLFRSPTDKAGDLTLLPP